MTVKTRAQLVTDYGDAAFDMAKKGDALVRDVVDSLGGWSQAATWTYSSAVAEVIFADLGAYQELMLLCFELNTSISAGLCATVSSNNGSSFYAGGTDYRGASGGNAAETRLQLSSNAATARSLGLHIPLWNKACPKPTIPSTMYVEARFINRAEAMNALRIFPTSGNISAGSMQVWGKS